MLHLLVWLEPGYICSKARIFALELLPKEDCKLDTLKLSYLAIWTCVFHIDPGYRGQETRGMRQGSWAAGKPASPQMSAVDGEMASQRFPR